MTYIKVETLPITTKVADMSAAAGDGADHLRRRRRQLLHRGDAARRAGHDAVLQPARCFRRNLEPLPGRRRDAARARCSTPASWRSTASAARAATSSTTSTSSLLVKLGVIRTAHVRSPTITVDPVTQREIDELLEQLPPG